MTRKEYLASMNIPKGCFIGDVPQWTEPLYECPKCGGHVCRSYTMGVELTCNPPIYQDLYRCMDCGFEEYIGR